MAPPHLKELYMSILRDWNRGDGYTEIYYLIVQLFAIYRHLIDEKEEAEHLWNRMVDDDIHYIVHDFLYGVRYMKLRDELEYKGLRIRIPKNDLEG